MLVSAVTCDRGIGARIRSACPVTRSENAIIISAAHGDRADRADDEMPVIGAEVPAGVHIVVDVSEGSVARHFYRRRRTGCEGDWTCCRESKFEIGQQISHGVHRLQVFKKDAKAAIGEGEGSFCTDTFAGCHWVDGPRGRYEDRGSPKGKSSEHKCSYTTRKKVFHCLPLRETSALLTAILWHRTARANRTLLDLSS